MVTDEFALAMLDGSNSRVEMSQTTLDKLALLTGAQSNSYSADRTIVEQTIQLVTDWSLRNDDQKLTWAKALFNAKYNTHIAKQLAVTNAYQTAFALVNSSACTLRELATEVREIKDIVGRLRKTAESKGFTNTVEYLQSLVSIQQSAEA